MSREPKAAWRTLAAGIAAAVVVSIVAVLPPRAASTKTTYHAVGGSPGAPASPGGVPVAANPTAGPGAQPGTVLPPAPPELSCTGNNGGETDTGVTGTSIKLGATIVDSGIGASFLKDARFSMLAVANKVNRAGGICGRKLQLKLVDDGWDFSRGASFLRSLIDGEKVFALSVVPSSEGLRSLSDSGYLDRKRVPVVGSDGMLIGQYQDPYIWPVAASTVSTMHIIAQWAHDTGAKKFGIVYEQKYHFGLEGAYAFNSAVKRLTGADVPGYSNPMKNAMCRERFCGINPDAGSYQSEIQTFNSACNGCDFVALLLEPATALKWLTGGAITPSQGIRMAGPQPLFTRSFAEQCGSVCDKLVLWTGFDPPIGGNLGRSDVSTYVRDLSVTSSTADPTNTFAEGAYIGMSMLVDALTKVGPLMTRERLIAVLDSLTYASGLTRPLSWRPGNHFSNTTMQAYAIQFKDRFAGWSDLRTQVADPWVGKDIPR